MHRTRFEIRDANGRLLDVGDFINCPDLANERIDRALKDYPEATVTRIDDPDFYQGEQASVLNL